MAIYSAKDHNFRIAPYRNASLTENFHPVGEAASQIGQPGGLHENDGWPQNLNRF
jgi:hypothetical protein